MSRKYSSWASNQPAMNPDLSMRRLATIVGNEQDHLKNIERVEAIPHMYINVDAPPPPTTQIDNRAMQPTMISRQNSSFFAVPTIQTIPSNSQTKIWPVEKPSKDISSHDSVSSTSKRTHKHKHHHHHRHHGDKHHHHHHHHSRQNRAKSAESIRNRPNQRFASPSSKIMLANSQYIEQDQQQQQPVIIYREAPNGEGYTVDTNSLATVPYDSQNEATLVDDQQAPMIVYRDANFQQQPQQIVTDAMPQQYFMNQDQETFVQQADPLVYLQPQQSSQIVYCSDPNNQDYFCASNNNNIMQQPLPPAGQQQFVCLDNVQTAMQPTFINQMPVFNPVSANTNSQSVISLPQAQLQRTASIMMPQTQNQGQQMQIIQQPQQLQVMQQPQPIQVIQQPQSLQVMQQPQSIQLVQQPQQLQMVQQPQPFQIIQSSQPGQLLQLSQGAPQVLQAAPVLQTIQVPTQTIAASPQVLYQRPYDPAVLPIQNQQIAVAAPSLAGLSQPSYAPSRIIPATQGTQAQEPNMFRHALLRTVAGRTGVPIPAAAMGTGGGGGGGLQLVQSTAGAPGALNTKGAVNPFTASGCSIM